MENDFVQCTRLLEGKRIPQHEIARIICQPLPRTLSSRITSSSPGVLLANGDFVEGTFVGMEGNRVTISSVLLGIRSYDTVQQAVAVIIRDTEPALRDQSILFAKNVEIQPGAVVVDDKLFADIRIDETEIQALRIR